MAVLFGMIFWQQSPTLGISVGLCMGAAYGLFEGEGEETKENKEEQKSVCCDREQRHVIRRNESKSDRILRRPILGWHL